MHVLILAPQPIFVAPHWRWPLFTRCLKNAGANLLLGNHAIVLKVEGSRFPS